MVPMRCKVNQRPCVQCANEMPSQPVASVCAHAMQSQAVASVQCISSAHDLPSPFIEHRRNQLQFACKVIRNVSTVMKCQCQWNETRNPARQWSTEAMRQKCPPHPGSKHSVMIAHSPCARPTLSLETGGSCSSEHKRSLNHDHQPAFG